MLTRNGLRLPGTRALVALSSEEESRQVVAALEALAYKTTVGPFSDALDGGFDLVYTDDLDGIARAVPFLHPEQDNVEKIRIVVLVDDTNEAVFAGYSATADLIVPRPFDPTDPFDANRFQIG